MKHALIFHGKFEINRRRLRAATRTLIRERDGVARRLPRTTAEGIKFGYMLRSGHDVLVKVDDVVLDNPVPLDRRRHTQGKVAAPSPRLIDDKAAHSLLDDALHKNRRMRKRLTGAYGILGTTPPPLSGSRSSPIDVWDPDDLDAASAKEGGRRLRTHLAIERNRSLIKRKKEDIRRLKGRLGCEACGFDFGHTYPSLGRDFCEVHHRKGLAARGEPVETRLSCARTVTE